MKSFKIMFCLLANLLLAACTEMVYCPNPTQVLLLETLPHICCRYVGKIEANFCPDGAYSHKLQCLAAKKGANVVVLTNMQSDRYPVYPIYYCPPCYKFLPKPHNKTDFSNSCGNCPQLNGRITKRYPVSG